MAPPDVAQRLEDVREMMERRDVKHRKNHGFLLLIYRGLLYNITVYTDKGSNTVNYSGLLVKFFPSNSVKMT
jgi:hypothetical protein